MNDSLDKLIGNDELLTYICLILAILNTFLMSIIINDIKHHFSIYIFSLFEALFLIFIIYFLLKKKDIYNKDYDIKYDWYFYLRISIIILVFFNFALYIYNISNFPPINPKKTGGVLGEQVQKKTQNYLSKCFKLFYLYNIKKVKIYEKYNNWVRNIKKLNDSKNIKDLYETVFNYLLEYNKNLTILKLKEKAIIIGEKIKITKEYIDQLYDPNIDYEKRIFKQLENIMKKYELIKKVDTIQKEPMSDNSNNTLDTYLKELTDLNLTDLNLTDLDLTDLDLKEFTEEEKKYLLSKDDDGGEDALSKLALSKLQESIKRIDNISPNDELKNLEKEQGKKEAKEKAKKEAKEKAKKEAKEQAKKIYKNIKELVTKNNSETDKLIKKKAKDLATEQINEISEKIKEAKEKAKEKAKEAKDKGETKEERIKRIDIERMAKNERYKDRILEKILRKSLKDKLLKNIKNIEEI